MGRRWPMAECSKTLDFEYELEIAQVRILSTTLALFISTIDLVLYRLSRQSVRRTGKVSFNRGSPSTSSSEVKIS
ncbi:hypothetical protein J6590_091187 [Homalodisca vitripennis]|nr:hypothetical protein J6590_091187 [Homalodisca vitripennis]